MVSVRRLVFVYCRLMYSISVYFCVGFGAYVPLYPYSIELFLTSHLYLLSLSPFFCFGLPSTPSGEVVLVIILSSSINMKMNMLFAGMALMVVVVVVVGGCCPCLPSRSAPLHVENYVEKSTCRTTTSSPARMGRPCEKSDKKNVMGRTKGERRHFVCLSFVDYV